MVLLREDRRPLAMQVRDGILEMLQSNGDYHAGRRLPSEQELAIEYGVSRATVREALKILEEERVILCRHGVGRFLAPEPSDVVTEEMTRLKSVTEMVQGRGLSLETEVLALRAAPAGPAVGVHLGLDPKAPVVILERLRKADGEPLIFSTDIFPRSIVVGELHPEDFAGSLLSIMEQNWNVHLSYSKAVIRAVHLDPTLSRRVKLSKYMPWIFIEQVGYTAQDKPVVYAKDYHRGDKSEFRVLRRRR